MKQDGASLPKRGAASIVTGVPCQRPASRSERPAILGGLAATPASATLLNLFHP